MAAAARIASRRSASVAKQPNLVTVADLVPLLGPSPFYEISGTNQMISTKVISAFDGYVHHENKQSLCIIK